MKRLSLMLAAALPFAVMADQPGKSLKVDADKLRQATPASVLINENLKTRDGEDAGTIEDIVVSSDGQVKHFLVDANRDDLREKRQERQQVSADDNRSDRADIVAAGDRTDPVYEDESQTATVERTGAEDDSARMAGSEQEPVYEDDSQVATAERTGAADDNSRMAGSEREPVYEERDQRDGDSGWGWGGDTQLSQVDPKSVTYNHQSNEATIDSQDVLTAQQVSDDQAAQSTDEIRVSDIMGMDVHLSDEESFGSVDDVMLSEDNSEIVAIVVNNWEGLSRERRALPLEGAQFNVEDDAVSFEYSSAEVQQLPEFNLDRYTDDGWDLTDW